MDVKPLLQFLLNGSFKLLTEELEGMTDEEWRSRPFPGANLLGFTVWHCARTIDWAVNRVLRNSPELADLVAWRDTRGARHWGCGRTDWGRGIKRSRRQRSAGGAADESARVLERDSFRGRCMVR